MVCLFFYHVISWSVLLKMFFSLCSVTVSFPVLVSCPSCCTVLTTWFPPWRWSRLFNEMKELQCSVHLQEKTALNAQSPAWVNSWVLATSWSVLELWICEERPSLSSEGMQLAVTGLQLLLQLCGKLQKWLGYVLVQHSFDRLTLVLCLLKEAE